jgi:hypothetical protein
MAASGKIAVDLPGKLTDNRGMAGIEELLAVARKYAELEGVSLTTVSSRAFDDGKKLNAIEGGADIQVRRLDRALHWFSDNWPDGPWPSDVPRPEPVESAEARSA